MTLAKQLEIMLSLDREGLASQPELFSLGAGWVSLLYLRWGCWAGCPIVAFSSLGPWAVVKRVLTEAQRAELAAVTGDAAVLSGPLPPGKGWTVACQPAWLNDLLLQAPQSHVPHRRRGQNEAAFRGLAGLGFSLMTSPV